MISATATASASSAFHHTAECSHAAAPVPAMTGATALGNVRGRAPSIHCAKLATIRIVACPTMGEHGGREEQKFRERTRGAQIVGSDRRKRLLYVFRRGRAPRRGRDSVRATQRPHHH